MWDLKKQYSEWNSGYMGLQYRETENGKTLFRDTNLQLVEKQVLDI